MNTQNILKFFGSKLDLKLDSSEFYDFEITNNTVDYDINLLDFNTPIEYPSLKINTTDLTNADCVINTIALIEFNNEVNDPLYQYSGFSFTLPYIDFINHLNNQDTILLNDIYIFNDDNGVEHYFFINGFNEVLNNPFSLDVTGFTGDKIDCELKLSNVDGCCNSDPISIVKPWAYQINHGNPLNSCDFIIDRRPEKGWTIDLVFNKESLPWSDGNVFYYFGTRGDSQIEDYADNNLSFSFNDEGRIIWKKIHYSGFCGDSGYTENYYTLTGQTPILCSGGTSNDFNLTITFDRYKHLTECDIENTGGWNDLIPKNKTIPFTPESGSSITSTQTTVYIENEELTRKWALNRENRLGVLKIYLNSRLIYKYENFEEIVPSERGVQPFIQSWGAGTIYSGGIHNSGVSCFNFKQIKYFDEPLKYPQIRHHYLSEIKNNYNITECNDECSDSVIGL